MESTSEEKLLEQVRQGDETAFGILFVRHRAYALGVARRVVGERDAEDVVAEAFERIFAILKSGRGPTATFRPYLSVTVHNVAVNRLRGRNREQVTEPSDLVPLLVTDDTSGRHLTSTVVRDAFASLPARWQQVLWLCEVDRVPHEEVGELLGIRASAVAALALRARRGLADAYLAQYAGSADSLECRKVVGHLPGYVNGHLTRARREAVDAHLQSCRSCPVAILELGEARRDVSALLAPLALSVAASGVVGTTSAGGIGAVVGGVGGVGKAVTGVLASTAAVGVVAGLALVAVRTPAPHDTAAPMTPTPTRTVVASDAGTPAPAASPAGAASRPDPTPPVAAARPAPGKAAPAPRRRTVDALGHDARPVSPAPSAPPRAEAPAVPSPDTPTTNPTDGPTPVTSDPRLGTPAWGASPSGPAWRRVTIQVDGDGQPVQVVLGGVGATSYCVAVAGAVRACTPRAQHSPWADTARAGAGTTLLTIDVKAAQTTYLTVGITGVEDRDADPGNNERSIAVPSPGRSDHY